MTASTRPRPRTTGLVTLGVAYPTAAVPVCSPAHPLVNGAFVGLGLALVAGVLLLWPTLPGRLGTAAGVLWLVSGASSVATGLVPLDVDLALHALVSTPAIALQPVALGLHALALAAGAGRAWWLVAALGFVLVPVAVVFLVRLDVQGGGLLERAAIWPPLMALPLLGLTARRRTVPVGRHLG